MGEVTNSSTAADKITAASALLTSAFDDTRQDTVTLTKEQLLEQVVAVQRALNTAWALQCARLAQAAAIEEHHTPDHTSPDGWRTTEIRHAIGTHQDEFIGSEIGPMLGWTPRHAIDRVAEATDVITRTPRLFRHVAAGDLQPAKLTTIHRALGRISTTNDDGDPVTIDHARQVETALLGDDPDDPATSATLTHEEATAAEGANLDLLTRQSSRQLQLRTDKILAAIDHTTATAAADRRRRDRIGVFTRPDDEPGLTHLHATLHSQAAAKIMAAVNDLARHLHTDTTTSKTLAECRADALTDLILNHADITTQLVIQVPIHHTTAGQAADTTRTGAEGTAFQAAADTTEAHDGTAAGAFGSGGGSDCSWWPAAFAHPITGLTTHPHGTPATASQSAVAPAASVAGARAGLKSPAQVEAEFNDLLKRLYPPDPADHDPTELADDWAQWQEHQRFCDDTTARALQWPPPHATPRATTGAGNPTTGCAWLGDTLIPGVGVIPAAVVQELSRSFGTTVTRALVDIQTGVTVETGQSTYRPGAKLASFVRTRDAHCRFPGCTRPARYCDLDHIIPWPAGPTAAANLHCLCRHHHRAKQATGWSVTMTPDGVSTWTSPSGRTYTTTPAE